MHTIRHLAALAARAIVTLPLLAAAAHAAPVLGPGFTSSLIATLPGPNSSFAGDIAFDNSGNRYVTGGNSNAVYKVSAAGVVTSFADPVNGTTVRGLEVVGNDLYVGSSLSAMTRVNLATGVATTLANSGNLPMSLAYGAGKLFVGTINGLQAYDTATNTYAATSLSTGQFNSLAFAIDGSLLVSDYVGNRILKYDPATNTSSVFRTGIAASGGIAVQASTGLVYAASEATNTLLEISTDGLSSSIFASGFATDPGVFPTALTFSKNGADLYYLQGGRSGSSEFEMHAISGFQALPGLDSNNVPEPGALALVMLGLGAGFMARRRTPA
jgi:hypothetical protein